MINFIKNLLGIGAKEVVTPAAPYKVEAPNEVVITRALAPASNPDVIVTPVAAKRANAKKQPANSSKPKTARPAAKKSKPKAKSKK